MGKCHVFPWRFSLPSQQPLPCLKHLSHLINSLDQEMQLHLFVQYITQHVPIVPDLVCNINIKKQCYDLLFMTPEG